MSELQLKELISEHPNFKGAYRNYIIARGCYTIKVLELLDGMK